MVPPRKLLTVLTHDPSRRQNRLEGGYERLAEIPDFKNPENEEAWLCILQLLSQIGSPAWQLVRCDWPLLR